MGLISNTGLLATVTSKDDSLSQDKTAVPELRFEVTPAPFILRPYAGLYNPFAHGCSVLCNHPADRETKEFVKRFKDAWVSEGKGHLFHDDFSKFQDASSTEKEKNKTPHDIVTEDMFRRYTETDSRPLTPAPTLASGKSRGSRRCLTPDQPHPRTTIVVDLRRSHSQETLYYHGHTSDLTSGQQTTSGNDQSLPSMGQSEATQKLSKVQCEQLPPLASPVVLAKRASLVKEPLTARSMKVNRTEPNNKTQLKALNLGKPIKGKKEKSDKNGPSPATERSKESVRTEGSELVEAHVDDNAEPEIRRRGKRRRKGRAGGSDRLTSAGLAAHTQQDPETQIAGIGGDSNNPSSRGSIAPQLGDEDFVITLPAVKPTSRKTDSFLDDDILKFLHREVDEDAIETEFNVKRRYVLEEAYRTRPDRPMGDEMRALLREVKLPAVSDLADWLHIPRVFSRQNAHFSLPIDSNDLENLTPMQFAARHVTLKKSKQLLYMTVLRQFRPTGYRMPITNIEEGLILMMGGIMTAAQASQFRTIMEWEHYDDEDCPDDIKVTLLETGSKRYDAGDQCEPDIKTLKYRTWCGLCAICERIYGRFPPRCKDLPSGIELSDFTSLETKLNSLKVHPGLAEILHTIQTR